MKYQKMIDSILDAVGGKGNIDSATHCFTRLRLQLKNLSLVDDNAVKKISGVTGINKRGKEYQIIIGTEVGNVYDEFISITKFKSEAQIEIDDDNYKESFFDKITGIVVGTFIPLIGLIAACGILKGLISILVQTNLLSTDSGTYTILFSTANVIYYFFPVFVGFTAGKKFGASPYLAALVGAILIYPMIVDSVSLETASTFVGIPLRYINYSSTVLPAIFSSWVVSVFEKFFKKVIPHVLQMVFVPFFVLILTVPLVFLIVGPLVTLLSDGLSVLLDWIYAFSPILTGVIFGGFWQLIVLFGLAWGITPVLINYMVQYGFDPIYGMVVPAAMGQAGAVLAVAIRSKNKEIKSLGFSTGITGILGVTEPAMYGINIPAKKPFIFGSIGSAIAGGIAGMMGVKIYAPGLSGIFNVFAYFGSDNIGRNVFWGIFCLIIAFVISFLLTYFFCDWNDENFEGKISEIN